jgi:hypothetical protein
MDQNVGLDRSALDALRKFTAAPERFEIGLKDRRLPA